MFQILTGVGEESSEKENIKQIIVKLRNVGENIASTVSYFLLALLFSFLILLDLPTFSKNFTRLKDTKINFIYNEVADSIQDFALVLGQALEAQFIIAVFNTITDIADKLVLSTAKGRFNTGSLFLLTHRLKINYQ